MFWSYHFWQLLPLLGEWTVWDVMEQSIFWLGVENSLIVVIWWKNIHSFVSHWQQWFNFIKNDLISPFSWQLWLLLGEWKGWNAWIGLSAVGDWEIPDCNYTVKNAWFCQSLDKKWCIFIKYGTMTPVLTAFCHYWMNARCGMQRISLTAVGG